LIRKDERLYTFMVFFNLPLIFEKRWSNWLHIQHDFEDEDGFEYCRTQLAEQFYLLLESGTQHVLKFSVLGDTDSTFTELTTANNQNPPNPNPQPFVSQFIPFFSAICDKSGFKHNFASVIPLFSLLIFLIFSGLVKLA
jgi:hypothetical protein